MRSSSPPVSGLLWWACLLFAGIALATAAVGIAGVRATAQTGRELARDELATLNLTAKLGQDSKNLQLSVQSLLLAPDAARRAEIGGVLYNELVPATEADLIALERTHGSDDHEEKADIQPLAEQWVAVRSYLNSVGRPVGMPVEGAVGEDLAAVFAPFDTLIERVSVNEQADATADEATAERLARGAQAAITAAAAAAVLATAGFGFVTSRRWRRAAEPAHQQAEFTDALQLAGSEEEAHFLLHRHLEQVVVRSEVTVLSRNNSADRLESVAPLAPDSVLRAGLEHAEPRTCLAVRSGSAHEEGQAGLLACVVCAVGGGRSLCTPLTVGGEVIGAVLVSRAAAYDGSDRQRIRDSVAQAAPVLANLRNLALAEQRAATDSLTGLPNKRTVGDSIKRLLAVASRTSRPLCLLMLDLDHFRDINERFGHPVGDQALASVGAALRSTLREGDFAGRNGGEEFVVLLPDTDLEAGTATAEKLRAAVAQVSLPGVELSMTVSIGLAVHPDHASSAERLERSADSALYVAKRSGRDRVEVATAPVEALTARPAPRALPNGTTPAAG